MLANRWKTQEGISGCHSRVTEAHDHRAATLFASLSTPSERYQSLTSSRGRGTRTLGEQNQNLLPWPLDDTPSYNLPQFFRRLDARTHNLVGDICSNSMAVGAHQVALSHLCAKSFRGVTVLPHRPNRSKFRGSVSVIKVHHTRWVEPPTIHTRMRLLVCCKKCFGTHFDKLVSFPIVCRMLLVVSLGVYSTASLTSSL